MSKLEDLMRPHMAKIATYHGVDPSAELARKAGIKPEDVIRLNANENPYGAFDKVAEALTPVPGGVGPMTIACLLSNTVECFKKAQK